MTSRHLKSQSPAVKDITLTWQIDSKDILSTRNGPFNICFWVLLILLCQTCHPNKMIAVKYSAVTLSHLVCWVYTEICAGVNEIISNFQSTPIHVSLRLKKLYRDVDFIHYICQCHQLNAVSSSVIIRNKCYPCIGKFVRYISQSAHCLHLGSR